MKNSLTLALLILFLPVMGCATTTFVFGGELMSEYYVQETPYGPTTCAYVDGWADGKKCFCKMETQMPLPGFYLTPFVTVLPKYCEGTVPLEVVPEGTESGDLEL